MLETLRDTKEVETQCTCGARLLDDSRFCHRCGRPVNGHVELEETPAEPIAPVIEPPVQPTPRVEESPAQVRTEINFHNGVAVRACLIAASLIYLLMMATARVGGPALGLFMTLLGGGYAAFLYRRRSGQPLTVRGGARVGWMAGVFSFVISTVLLTFAALLMAGDGGLAEVVRQGVSEMKLPTSTTDRMVEVLKNPALAALVIVFSLVFQFMTMTVLGSVGGALSAKLLERNS